jgi:hypothetical protein
MTQAAPGAANAVARTVTVVLLSMLVFGTTLANLSLVWNNTGAAWTPNGETGMQTDYNGRVKAVASGSTAERNGILPGDRVDLARTPFASRVYVSGSPARAPAGRRIPLWILRDGTERPVTLIPQPAPYPAISKLGLILRTLAAAIFIAVGGVLVLARPSPMTWGFFLYCLGYSPGIAFASFARFPGPGTHVVDVLLGDVLTAAGTAGVLVFALDFLAPPGRTWRHLVRSSLPLLALGFAGLIVYPDVANMLLGRPAETVQRYMLAVQGLVFLLSMYAILETYVRGDPLNRPRIRWVVAGLFVGLAGTYLAALLAFSSVLPVTTPRWVQSLLFCVNTALPLTVAYAVIRHRVVDVSFVINRALVFALVSGIVIVVFSLIEWFVGHELDQARLALTFEIAFAIALSFWMSGIEKRLGSLVDGIFFRNRREALARLALDARAVAHATLGATVDRYVVSEAAACLSLSSAALFRRDGDGGFRRVLAFGWPDAPQPPVSHDAPLVLALEADWNPLRLVHTGWQLDGAPGGERSPVLAIPIIAQRSLAGFVLYGPHDSGAEIDPDEVKGLAHLCRAAQVTYESLRAQELESELARLRATRLLPAATSGGDADNRL